MEVSVPRLIGSATAATQPGSLTFEVQVRPAGGSSYVLQRRYKEFAQLQAELIRNGQISSPVLTPISKSAGVESRREGCEALLRSMTHGVVVVESVGVFLETMAPSVEAEAPSVEANSTFARPTSAEPSSRPRSRSVEPPRRQSRSSTTAASPPASPMGLEDILDIAVSTGMTTPELAGKMHDNVRSGKFTEDHYIRLWSKRLSDASGASDSSGASVAAHPDDGRSSSRVCVAQTASGRLAASAAAAAVSSAATSSPSLSPRTPGYSPGRMSSRAPDSAIPASPAPSAEEVAALLQEALSLGLTTPPLLERMLDNMRHGRFTPEHYHKLFAQQVVERRAANQSFAGSPTFASPDGAGAALTSRRRSSLSSPPHPELAAPAGRPGEDAGAWARVQAQRQAQALSGGGGESPGLAAVAGAGTSPARYDSGGRNSPTHLGRSPRAAAALEQARAAAAAAAAAAAEAAAAAAAAGAGAAREPRRQSLEEYKLECLRLDAEEEARLEAEALGAARAAARRRESIEAERLAAEAVVAKAARAEAAKAERAAEKARAKAEAEALQAAAEAEAAEAAAAAVGSISIAAASGYSSRTSELLREIVRAEVSAAHDGVQGAALDAAVYSVLRENGAKVHELAAASPAAMPGGGCYSACTQAYLTAQQAAYRGASSAGAGRPSSPPYLPAAAFHLLSAAEKANYEMIPPTQQQPAPSAVRRPGLRGVGSRRAKAPSP
jgi:hypothetical protein